MQFRQQINALQLPLELLQLEVLAHHHRLEVFKQVDPVLDALVDSLVVTIHLLLDVNAVVQQLLLLAGQHIADVLEAQMNFFAHFLTALLVKSLAVCQLFELEFGLFHPRGVQ